MPTPGEHKTVQARILEYAEAIGWTFVSREEAEQRRGFDIAETQRRWTGQRRDEAASRQSLSGVGTELPSRAWVPYRGGL